MENQSSTLTAKEIRTLNIKKDDVLGFDYQDEKNYLTVNAVRTVSFTSGRDRRKSFDKIKRMGLGLGWNKPQLTDEQLGLAQAGRNEENPFAYCIISK